MRPQRLYSVFFGNWLVSRRVKYPLDEAFNCADVEADSNDLGQQAPRAPEIAVPHEQVKADNFTLFVMEACSIPC